eukprot:PITA_22662
MGFKISKNLSLSILLCIVSLLLSTDFSTGKQLSTNFDQRPVVDRFQKSLDLDDGGAVFSVDSYGAKGDGSSDDSQAFLAAWNATCAASSGSVFMVPEGKKYLVGPIILSGPCKGDNLFAQISGSVVAPADPSTWNSPYASGWLRFSTVQGLTIQGSGIIDGSGQKWWECKRDQAFVIASSENVYMKDLKIQNSPQVHVEITISSNVQLEHLQIVAPGQSPNTDGIHVSASQNVTIQDCSTGTGDDCVSIVTGSSDIHINNLTCGPGHGISIGSLGKDNSKNTVSNVVVNGASITGTENGVRIKTWQGGSGYVRQVVFQNVKMTNVSNPIIIDQYYCAPSKSCQNQTSAVRISDVRYTNITGTSATQAAIELKCSTTVPCTDIVLQDINLTLNSGDNATSFLANAQGSSAGQVIPPVNFSQSSL